jgi:hypothetical protein
MKKLFFITLLCASTQFTEEMNLTFEQQLFDQKVELDALRLEIETMVSFMHENPELNTNPQNLIDQVQRMITNSPDDMQNSMRNQIIQIFAEFDISLRFNADNTIQKINFAAPHQETHHRKHTPHPVHHTHAHAPHTYHAPHTIHVPHAKVGKGARKALRELKERLAQKKAEEEQAQRKYLEEIVKQKQEREAQELHQAEEGLIAKADFISEHHAAFVV